MVLVIRLKKIRDIRKIRFDLHAHFLHYQVTKTFILFTLEKFQNGQLISTIDLNNVVAFSARDLAKRELHKVVTLVERQNQFVE